MSSPGEFPGKTDQWATAQSQDGQGLDSAQSGADVAEDGGPAILRLLESSQQELNQFAELALHHAWWSTKGTSELVKETLAEAQRRFDRLNGCNEDELRELIREILSKKLSYAIQRGICTARRTMYHRVRRETRPNDGLLKTVDVPIETRNCNPDGPDAVPGNQMSPVDALPELEAKTIHLRVVEGLLFAEIADQLEISPEEAQKAFVAELLTIHSTSHACEPAADVELDDPILQRVLEIDAALFEGRPRTCEPTSNSQLDDSKRELLKRMAQRLEKLYASALIVPEDQVPSIWTTIEAREFNDQPNHSNFLSVCQIAALFHGQPTRIGRFEVQRKLGIGSHGIVVLARDTMLNRLVALKVPRPDSLLNAALRKRFITEGQTAAGLAHPNIVTVFESGQIDSICYLAQDYIAGPTLAEWLKGHATVVSPDLAARFMLQLADAVATAHEQGILHRDIKPANILLAPKNVPSDLRELDAYIPKLADFSIAKLMQDDQQTSTGEVVGTPAYMSPEQAAGRIREIGVRSDLYSLGCVFYELLTHRPLFGGENWQETLQQVLHGQFARPRAIHPAIPRDLEAVCLKCLRHDAQERYASVVEFAAELRRFLDGRSVSARPQSVSTMLNKWARRNPSTALTSALAALALASTMFISLWYNARLTESLSIVRQQEESLEQQTIDLKFQTSSLRRRVFADEMRRAGNAFRDGRTAEVVQRLEGWRPQPGEAELRSFPWWLMSHELDSASHVLGSIPAGTLAASIAISPDGQTVATGEPDGVIRLRSLESGDLLGELRGHAVDHITSLQFFQTTAGLSLVSGSEDGSVRVWNPATRQNNLTLISHQGEVTCVCVLGQNGEAIASGGDDRKIRIWDANTGELQAELAGHNDSVRTLVEQPGTGVLFSAAMDQSVRMWNWKVGAPHAIREEAQLPIPDRADWARSLAMEADGSSLLGGFRSGRLLQWIVQPGNRVNGQIVFDEQFASGIRSLAWLDERTAAVAFADSRLLILPLSSKSAFERRFLLGHTDWILGVAATRRNGADLLVSISKDGSIRRWKVGGDRVLKQGSHLLPLPEQAHLNHGIEGSSDGVVAGRFIQAPMSAFACDGERCLSREDHDGKRFYVCRSMSSGQELWRIPIHGNFVPRGVTRADRKLAFLSMNEDVWGVDPGSGEQRFRLSHPKPLTALVAGRNQNWIITGCQDGVVRIWDAATGQLAQQFEAHRNSVLGLTLSEDESLLATTGEDLLIRIWLTGNWQESSSFGAPAEISEVYFVDGGRTLIARLPKELIFWSVPDQIEVLRWPCAPHARVQVSRDGAILCLQDGEFAQLMRGTP